MPKQLHIRYDLCTGCRACELACALKKEAAFWTETASIRVRQVGTGPLDIPVFCHQCSDHPCVQACPAADKALWADEEGIVRVQEGFCFRSRGIDCQRCRRACPGNSIAYHPVSNLPMFCDRCGGSRSAREFALPVRWQLPITKVLTASIMRCRKSRSSMTFI